MVTRAYEVTPEAVRPEAERHLARSETLLMVVGGDASSIAGGLRTLDAGDPTFADPAALRHMRGICVHYQMVTIFGFGV